MTDAAVPSVLPALQAWSQQRRIAIVHDWLVVQGGAEKVLDALLQAFPQADVFSLVDFLPPAERGRLARHRVTPSALQRLPLARHYYRHLLPWMPYAIEQFDLRDYDLVISSSHCVAKGVITHPHQRHLCYCHTPMRYAWDMKEAYLRDSGVPPALQWPLRRCLGRLRQWDQLGAAQVDGFIANSANVARRIAKYYRREAEVIHPPVDLARFPLNEEARDDVYLAAGRLVPYKRLDLIIQAFRDSGRRLEVIGDGPERKRLARLAEGAANIELLGYQTDDVLVERLRRARGFVFAAEEDFGILPLEAQACGTPVIAFGRGGARETVIGAEAECPPPLGATGVFFAEQSAASLNLAVDTAEHHTFDPQACRRQAERFAVEAFWQGWQRLLSSETYPIPRQEPCA
ncbi:glycosyltransferase [Halomonas sp.]|uniref:glycosyltransferase n=1 Tax=Halomonas sp. TaxID=1486246 RepID=UPI003D0EE419